MYIHNYRFYFGFLWIVEKDCESGHLQWLSMHQWHDKLNDLHFHWVCDATRDIDLGIDDGQRLAFHNHTEPGRESIDLIKRGDR